MTDHMVDHMSERSPIGSKEWWLDHIKSRNASSLQPLLKIDNQSADEPFLYIVKNQPGLYDPQESESDEKYLKDCFRGLNLFENRPIDLEESVKLGNDQKKIDMVAPGYDSSRWVVEFKIVEEKREAGESKMPINIERMGMSIGQVLLYSASYREKYPSQKWNIMPVICVWQLGTGADQVIRLCKRLGVTAMTLDVPEYVAHYTNVQGMKIYYLDDDNPRLFLSDNR